MLDILMLKINGLDLRWNIRRKYGKLPVTVIACYFSGHFLSDLLMPAGLSLISCGLPFLPESINSEPEAAIVDHEPLSSLAGKQLEFFLLVSTFRILNHGP